MRNESSFEQNSFAAAINVIPQSNFAAEFPLHWHQYIEIIICLDEAPSGNEPKIAVDDATHSLNPGELLFIWPGQLHEIISNKSGCLAGIQFSTKVFQEIPESGSMLKHFYGFSKIPVNAERLQKNAFSIFKKIISLNNDESFFLETKMRIELYKLFIIFGEYMRATYPELFTSHTTETVTRINETCRYISENCENELSLNDTAEHAGFSPYYFSRTFKSVTGYSFVEYLTEQRIAKAQTLLADQSLSITDVAYSAGFQSISTFNRAFLQRRGLSPREFRKYYVENENGRTHHDLD